MRAAANLSAGKAGIGFLCGIGFHAAAEQGCGQCGKPSIAFDALRLVDIGCRSGPPLVGFAVYPKNDCPAPAGLSF
jgi:hypothetical protein